MRQLLTLVLLMALAACTSKRSASKSSATDETNEAISQEPRRGQGSTSEGEATGAFTANGDTITLRYAYADRSTRFGKESIIVLLNDKSIPNGLVKGRDEDSDLSGGKYKRSVSFTARLRRERQ